MTLTDLINDLMILAGLVLIGAGFYLIYPPAAAVSTGALLLILGVAGAIRGGR